MRALPASSLLRMLVSVTGAAGGAGTPHEGAVSAAVGRWRKCQHRAGRPVVFLYRRGGARPPFPRHQAIQGNRARAALTGISSFRAPRNGELGMTSKGGEPIDLLRRRFECRCRRDRFERRLSDLLDPLGPDEAEFAARRLGN